jgi:acyl dehydratase
MAMTIDANTSEQYISKETAVSSWFTMTQAQIDSIADATHDHQFIQVDPQKAKHTPFGSTIAHGFYPCLYCLPWHRGRY